MFNTQRIDLGNLLPMIFLSTETLESSTRCIQGNSSQLYLWQSIGMGRVEKKVVCKEVVLWTLFNHHRISIKTPGIISQSFRVSFLRDLWHIPSQTCLFCISFFRVCLFDMNMIYASTKSLQIEVCLASGSILIPRSVALRLNSPHPHMKRGSWVS